MSTMHRTASIISATLLLTAAWSEDAPVAPPAPPAATPVVAPAPAAEQTPAAPAAAAPAGTPAPAPAASKAPTEDAVYINPTRRVRPAVAPQARSYSFGLSFGIGYDSNILLENTDTPTATNAKGTATVTEARGQYRLVDGPKGRVGIFASAELDDYPTERQAQLIRYGGGLTAGTSFAGWDPGLVVGYNRFLIDHEHSADALNVNAYAAKVMERNVSVIGIGSQYVKYQENEPITGTLYDLSYRHWYLFEAGQINRRLELGLRAGKNRTTDDDFAYSLLTPSAGILWRIGDKPTFGTQDLALRLQYEFRQYPEPKAGGDGDRQRLATLTGGYDHWLASWLSAGLYAGYSRRVATVESEEYKRWQTGARLSATW